MAHLKKEIWHTLPLPSPGPPFQSSRQSSSLNSCQDARKRGQWCGSAGRAVASNTKDWQFESCHQQILFNINCIESVSKRRKQRKKVSGMAHLKNNFTWCKILVVFDLLAKDYQ